MTQQELSEVVEQRMYDPVVLGRLACNLRTEDAVQRHHDDRQLAISWRDAGDFWRCTITDAVSSRRLVQADIHENGTFRVDSYEPCRVTVSPLEGFLCLTCYKP